MLGPVALPDERDRLRDPARDVPSSAGTRCFQRQESVYKAWFPLAGRWLGLGDANVTINAADGTRGAAAARGAASSGVPPAGSAAGGWRVTGCS